MNTGSLAYHQYIKEVLPAAVASYEEFNGVNPFDPIKLEGALLDPEEYCADKHSILSAVITYHTPLKLSNGEPVTISFALGKDTSIDTIIGIPFIKEMKLELRFDPERYLSHVLKKQFAVNYVETKLTKPPTPAASAATVIPEKDGPSVIFHHSVKAVEPLQSILHNTAAQSTPPSKE